MHAGRVRPDALDVSCIATAAPQPARGREAVLVSCARNLASRRREVGPWPARIAGGVRALIGTALIGGALVGTAACSPLVRDAPFGGARDHVADVDLTGPYNGQIVDGTTNAPVGDVTVVGVWSYDTGDGLVGPAGSQTFVTRTDRAGRYRIPAIKPSVRGRTVRLVDFTLFVYKRGYVAYRSDVPYDGGRRTEFVARHNRVALRKWTGADSHAAHLLMLSPPPEIERLTGWERSAANAALLRQLSGAAPTGGPSEPTPDVQLQWLDATALLPPEEVRRRTGYLEAFDVRSFVDLARTHFYHGLHLRAVDREETWDIGVRVWRDPPGGLEPVIETFRATLPGVEPTGDITDETWVLDQPSVRAVAFVDRERKIGVLLTCGGEQCVDVETALILASFVHDHLDGLTMVPIPADAPIITTPPSPATTPTPAPRNPP